MAPNGFHSAELEQFVADDRFSQVLDLPADAAAGRTEAIRISYADYGCRNADHPERENVFLFFGPLLGSRMIHVAKDALAKKHGVRIINPDRPGFGQTTDVPPEKRLSFWRDAVLALLQHLQIRHVSMGTQSAGTVYALDFILHHPEVLHPESPYLAIGAPWIHPSHSGSMAMTIVDSLPKVLLRQTDKFASLVATVSAPTVATSFGLADMLRSWTSVKNPDPAENGADAADGAVAFEEALEPKMIDFVYTGSVHGLSQEPILLMQRVEGVAGWGDWGDYDKLAPRLRQVLRESGRRLVIETFLAESDYMVGDAGKAGPSWFESCWDDVEDSVIEFSSRVVSGADHNSIWSIKHGGIQAVFSRIGSVESRDAEQP